MTRPQFMFKNNIELISIINECLKIFDSHTYKKIFFRIIYADTIKKYAVVKSNNFII